MLGKGEVLYLDLCEKNNESYQSKNMAPHRHKCTVTSPIDLWIMVLKPLVFDHIWVKGWSWWGRPDWLEPKNTPLLPLVNHDHSQKKEVFYYKWDLLAIRE